jgi:hypothetical protein
MKKTRRRYDRAFKISVVAELERHRRRDLQVIRTSPQIEPLLDPCIHRPESMQIIRLLHQRWRHRGVDLRRGQPLVPYPLLNHGHRHACHQRIHHMAVPEDMGRYLSPGELLPARKPPGSRPLLPAGLWSEAPSWCSGVRSSGLGRATSGPGQELHLYPPHFIGAFETNFQSKLSSNY